MPTRPTAPTKAETALLPPFPGLRLEDIRVPRSESEVAAAQAEIMAAGVTGFDTEAKPTFSAGERSTGPHVVQFALPEKAFIFQLVHAACAPAVANLLQSAQLLKVGFGLKNDHGQIRSRFGIVPHGILDLETEFRRMGYNRQIGVRAAVGAVLNQSFRKSKAITTSNWASPALSPRQLIYAANDAYAALMVMRALKLPLPGAGAGPSGEGDRTQRDVARPHPTGGI